MVSGQGKISADQNVIYFCLGVSAVDFGLIGWGAGGGMEVAGPCSRPLGLAHWTEAPAGFWGILKSPAATALTESYGTGWRPL